MSLIEQAVGQSFMRLLSFRFINCMFEGFLITNSLDGFPEGQKSFI